MRWKTVAIELTGPIEELPEFPGYDGVHAVFFLNAIPLGHCEIAATHLPASPQQVANHAANAIALAVGDYLSEEGFLSALPGLPEPPLRNPLPALSSLVETDRPIKKLAGKAPIPPQPSPSLSVVICTRERPQELARCLSSLADLSQPPLEVLVVDNAPKSHRTREVVAGFPGVRYINEPRKGLSSARNTALRSAAGDVVAFIDDDAVAHPQWAARIRRCFDDPEIMVATGLVLAAELETPAQLLFEQNLKFFHQGYRRRRFDPAYFAALRKKCVPVWEIGAGANMAIRRSAFQRGHQFDTRLGPGVFGGCGEDSEFWYGILAAGGTCVYEPSACVFHYHRRELSELRQLVYRYMQGHVAALLLQFAKYGDFGNLRRLLFRLPAEYALLMLRLIVSGFAINYRILLRGVIGCLAGLAFAIRRPHRV